MRHLFMCMTNRLITRLRPDAKRQHKDNHVNLTTDMTMLRL